MKNFNVTFTNDERNIVIAFVPREENGNVQLDYGVTVNPPIEEGTAFTEDDKTLIYAADLFLAALQNNTPAETSIKTPVEPTTEA